MGLGQELCSKYLKTSGSNDHPEISQRSDLGVPPPLPPAVWEGLGVLGEDLGWVIWGQSGSWGRSSPSAHMGVGVGFQLFTSSPIVLNVSPEWSGAHYTDEETEVSRAVCHHLRIPCYREGG